MISPFRDRSEFEESLNIYPMNKFMMKLEGFLGLLGALPILGSWEGDKKGFCVSRGTISGYENITRGGVKQFYLTGELCRVHKWIFFRPFPFPPFFPSVKYFYFTLKKGIPWIKRTPFFHHGKTSFLLFFFYGSLIASFPLWFFPPLLYSPIPSGFFPSFLLSPRPFFPP